MLRADIPQRRSEPSDNIIEIIVKSDDTSVIADEIRLIEDRIAQLNQIKQQLVDYNKRTIDGFGDRIYIDIPVNQLPLVADSPHSVIEKCEFLPEYTGDVLSFAFTLPRRLHVDCIPDDNDGSLINVRNAEVRYESHDSLNKTLKLATIGQQEPIQFKLVDAPGTIRLNLLTTFLDIDIYEYELSESLRHVYWTLRGYSINDVECKLNYLQSEISRLSNRIEIVESLPNVEHIVQFDLSARDISKHETEERVFTDSDYDSMVGDLTSFFSKEIDSLRRAFSHEWEYAAQYKLMFSSYEDRTFKYKVKQRLIKRNKPTPPTLHSPHIPWWKTLLSWTK